MTEKQLKLFKEKYEHKFDEAVSEKDKPKIKKLFNKFWDDISRIDFIENHGHHVRGK